MIKILLAEDHQIVRNGIKTMLEKEEHFEVIGEANNGLEVLSLLEGGVEADIVLTDISMPDMDGITLACELRDKFPKVKVVVLSMMDHEKYIFEAFEVGVKGYLLKNISIEEMIFSIKHVAADHQLICAELGIKMLKRALKYSVPVPVSEAATELTSRELEVLSLIAEGLTNNEIAEKLFTSRRTVEGHRQNLIDKTGVKNTAQLIKYACKSGIL